jgi:hypothetical protein
MALVELGRFSHAEAHILIGRLASEGVAAIAFDAGTSIAEGAAFVIPVRVMVDDEEVEIARAILPDF